MSTNFDSTKETCLEASDTLSNLGQLHLNTHTVVLSNENQPFGTCILIKYKGKKYLLTAAHVALQIGKQGYEHIGIVIMPDAISRDIPLHPACVFSPKLWDREFRNQDLQINPLNCKDLAIIDVPVFLESIINATKAYINLEDDYFKPLDLSARYVGHGIIKYKTETQMTSFGFVLHEKIEKDGLDYCIARAMKKTIFSKLLGQPPVDNFQGYSGGGLFLYEGDNIHLAGIAYFQDQAQFSKENGYIEVSFYGPQSIMAFLRECA